MTARGRATSMDAARWLDVRPLLDRALDLEGDARARWLAALLVRDAALHADVARLLAAAESDDTLERAARRLAASACASDNRPWPPVPK